MTDVKCIRCGGLTIGTTQICNVCEIELNPTQASSAGAVFYPANQADGSNRGGVRIRPFYGVGDVLSPTIELFTKNFWLITKITVVIAAPFEIFRAFSFVDIDYDPQLRIGTFILELLCTILIAPALIYALMQVLQTGVAPGVNESYRRGFSKLGKLTLCAFISWICMGLGTLLCIIPGIFIFLGLSLVFPIAILERGSMFEVLQRSWALTDGHRGNIFLATLVIVVLEGIVAWPIKLGGEYLVAHDPAFWPLYAASGIVAAIMQQATLVLSLVTYLSIRALWSQSSQY